MPIDRLEKSLANWRQQRLDTGALKGEERVITRVVPPTGDCGPRFLLDGFGTREFIRMNANDYLGLAFQSAVSNADHAALKAYGSGPGAVRFISGTWQPHIALEERLANFHDRAAAMIFNSAYATVMGVLPAMVDSNTAVFSDELNHNCIINAVRLAAPGHKTVYPHLDMRTLEQLLINASHSCKRALIVTDGVFSMRGDHAPLDEIMALARRYDHRFSENIIVMVDDSHGVGAYGSGGRGTEQVTDSGPVDLLVATLGKAIGVNGGYVTASAPVIDYLRETSPFYIYSNSIGPAEAAAAKAAVDLIDSDEGTRRLKRLKLLTHRFKQGLIDLGFQTVAGEHPVVALITGDTSLTQRMTDAIFHRGILATGLCYPVVPSGQEEIRFQLCADHTKADIDEVLDALGTTP